MSRSAKVTSIEVLDRFTAVLRSFQDDASTSLENLEVEIHRALDWINHTQKDHWRNEIRLGRQRVADAKAEYERARSARRFADHEPTLLAEKKVIERARRRLRLAEEKVELVRVWARRIDRAVIEYKGSAAQLSNWLLTDCPRALASLVRMNRALQSYVALQSTVAAPTAAGPEQATEAPAVRSGDTDHAAKAPDETSKQTADAPADDPEEASGS
ncbi:MAG: hypothetical protein V3R99_09950 [Thermoguttaceae bacterium]